MYGAVQNGDSFRIVVVAASQGALALHELMLCALPHPLPVPVVIEQHRSAGVDVARLLSTRTAHPVQELADGTTLQPGQVYLTPPRAITRVRDGVASIEPLAGGARCLRPADELFRSAAAYGRAVIAVVLSGRLDDGAAGVQEVKRNGGRVLVQEPSTAVQAGMPSAALATGCVDVCAPPPTIAAALSAFLTVPGAAELFRTRAPAWAHAQRVAG